MTDFLVTYRVHWEYKEIVSSDDATTQDVSDQWKEHNARHIRTGEKELVSVRKIEDAT